MAFTRAEVKRGVLWSWQLFVILLTSLTLALEAISLNSSTAVSGFASSLFLLLLVALIGAAVSGLVSRAVMPLAMALGRRLRYEHRRWIHVAAFLALGVVTGTVVGAGLGLLLYRNMLPDALPTLLLLAGVGAALTGISSVSGWWITMHQALRDDAAARRGR